MDFLDSKIQDYADKYTSPENEVLRELNEDTHSNVASPNMLSGHIQGRILAMISKMVKPKFILEIGTYTGYSAICLCEGLEFGGTLYTIDINTEMEDINKKYFDKAGVSSKIKKLTGNALELIPKIDHQFDLVFIDADKTNYANYYDMVFDKMNAGGIILADNVLWSGKVLLDEKEMDDDTKALAKFNEKIMNDNRVENILLPVRDGLMVIRKK
jgi:predicted O-methyltransferase YrrM